VNTSRKTLGSWILVVAGSLLFILGLRVAHFFYEFPAIPVFMTVTFWRDAVAFALIATGGAGLAVWGVVRLVRHSHKSG